MKAQSPCLQTKQTLRWSLCSTAPYGIRLRLGRALKAHSRLVSLLSCPASFTPLLVSPGSSAQGNYFPWTLASGSAARQLDPRESHLGGHFSILKLPLQFTTNREALPITILACDSSHLVYCQMTSQCMSLIASFLRSKSSSHSLFGVELSINSSAWSLKPSTLWLQSISHQPLILYGTLLWQTSTHFLTSLLSSELFLPS